MHQQQVVRTNDFAFKLANVNGTGSASANGLLMQAIFRMGIPVSGKNLFPSNIQGLPTWYEIRVNKDGHTARAIEYDLLVAMNVETYDRDVAEVKAGGWLLYDSSWPLPKHLHRPDIQFLGVPLAQLCNQAFAEPRERILMKNIAYAGVLVALLDIDMAVIDKLLEEKYGRKKALMDSNHKAIRLGYEYAIDNLSCPLPIRLAKMGQDGKDGIGGGEGDVGSAGNADKILIDGNTATALGCVYAGATVAAWYPITPATSVMDGFKTFCEKFRKDPATGKRNFCILQAEDELAAVGMVIGASWNGARAFTSTAGPGISLMSELLGLAYYAEIPAVVIDVQRTGPSTGMPTRTQQADILACAYASHGDTKHILLFPANPSECFHMAKDAFDLAERFQTPVLMLSDLDIGMNDWVTPRLTWDDSYRPNRGKVLTADELEAMAKEGKKFFRYSPADADNVAARTVPGTHAHGAFFTRGSGHNKLGGYTEIPDEYQDVVDRLARKHKSAAKAVPAPVIALSGTLTGSQAPREGAAAAKPPSPHADSQVGARIGVVSLGGCDPAVREGVALLAAKGVKVDYLRVRGFPFDDTIDSFLNGHDTNIVIEQNRDGQLRTLLVNETSVAKEKLRSLLVYGGFPLSARHVVDGVMKVIAELAPAEAAAPAAKPAGAPRGEERAS